MYRTQISHPTAGCLLIEETAKASIPMEPATPYSFLHTARAAAGSRQCDRWRRSLRRNHWVPLSALLMGSGPSSHHRRQGHVRLRLQATTLVAAILLTALAVSNMWSSAVRVSSLLASHDSAREGETTGGHAVNASATTAARDNVQETMAGGSSLRTSSLVTHTTTSSSSQSTRAISSSAETTNAEGLPPAAASSDSTGYLPHPRLPRRWETLSDQVRQKASKLRWRIPSPEFDGVPWNASAPEPIVLSRSAPRIILFPEFISPQERNHLIQLARREELERSRVMDGDSGNQQHIRTSSGAWLDDLQDDTLFGINQRINRATGIPWAFGENTHVLRYQPGEKYEAHVDSCFMGDFVGRRMDGRDGNSTQSFMSSECEGFLSQAGGPSCGFQNAGGGVTCGDRVATVLMYLKAPEEGGETAFPRSSHSFQSLSHYLSQGKPLPYGMDVETTSEVMCALPSTFKVVPRAGDAVLFWNYDIREAREDATTGPSDEKQEDNDPKGSALDGTGQTDAVVDLTSLHASCPVVRGEKWVATKWLRSSFYKPLFYME